MKNPLERLAGLFVFLYLFGTVGPALASPGSLTYQGRILNVHGQPLQYSSVSFQFEILNPSGSCILYREQVDGIDMTNSKGVFDVKIGASHSYPTDPTKGLSEIFNNSLPLTCYGGVVYSPLAQDGRVLRVKFHDGLAWRSISPDSVIRSVPYALYSEAANKIGTHEVGDLLLKTEVNGNASCSSGSFLTWDATTQTFGCGVDIGGASSGTVTNVSSANSYLSVTNPTNTPVLTINVGTAAGTVAAGNDARFTDARTPTGAAGGDLAVSYPNPTVAKIQGRAIDSTAPSDGQVLLWDNGNSTWKAQYVRMQDVRNAWGGTQMIPSSTCAANESMIWSVITDRFACQTIGSLNASAINAGTISSARLGSGTANNTTYLRGDGTWAAVSTSDATKLPLAGGTMAGNIDMGGNKILNPSNVPFVAANPTVTENGKSLRWNNASGLWEWFTAGAGGGTVTSVTAAASASNPITVAGTAADPTLDIANGAIVGAKLENSGVTAGDYSKVTVDAKGRVTAGLSLGAADIPNLDAAKITTGTISRDVSAANVTATNLKVYDGVGQYLTMTLATGGTGYSIKWPNAVGANNTVLQTDASGNLSWVAIPSAPVTSVAGRTGAVTLANTDISGLGTASTKNIPSSGDAAATEVVMGADTRLTDSRPPSGSASGDLSGNYPGPTVAKLQNRAVDATLPLDGQVLLWDNGNTTWKAQYVRMQDVRNAWGGTQMIPSSSCAANQSMTWSVVTDRFTCQSIGSLNASTITAGTIDDARLPANVTRWQDGAGGVIYYNGGNVGLGTSTPTSKLVVNGAARNLAAISNATGTVDFSTGNIQYTTSNCGAFNLHNLKDGGSYTFVVQGTTAATCVFSAYSDAGTTALTVHLPSGHGATTAGEHTIYSMIVAGTHIYFAWVTEFD